MPSTHQPVSYLDRAVAALLAWSRHPEQRAAEETATRARAVARMAGWTDEEIRDACDGRL